MWIGTVAGTVLSASSIVTVPGNPMGVSLECSLNIPVTVRSSSARRLNGHEGSGHVVKVESIVRCFPNHLPGAHVILLTIVSAVANPNSCAYCEMSREVMGLGWTTSGRWRRPWVEARR